MTTRHWLFKSEPAVYGIAHLASEPGQRVRWDGIRNFQARNFLRDEVATGDLVLFYHSSCKLTGIAGICAVISPAYPDPTQFDPESPYFDPKASNDSPRWFSVDIRLEKDFGSILGHQALKQQERLANMVLFRNGRLSVQPVTAEEFSCICEMAGVNLTACTPTAQK